MGLQENNWQKNNEIMGICLNNPKFIMKSIVFY